MFEIVNRQTDRLVEGFDAFAVTALRFAAITSGMFRKTYLCLVPNAAQQLRSIVS
jgi:hypothetical protein